MPTNLKFLSLIVITVLLASTISSSSNFASALVSTNGITNSDSTSNFNATLNAYVAVQSGPWNQNATWGGAIPTTTSNAVIPQGINVTITSEVDNGGTITNYGAITISTPGTYGIYNSGGINNSGGQILVANVNGTGIYNAAFSSTITNSGTITVSNSGKYGITNYNTFVNSGAIIVSNSGTYGIYEADFSTLSNSGAITVSNSGNYGLDNTAGLTNSGTIKVSSTGTYGILNNYGGNIANSGTINVSSSGTYGIYNYAVISNTLSGQIIVSNTQAGIGIDNDSYGTITNSGTINITCSGTISGTIPTSGNPAIIVPVCSIAITSASNSTPKWGIDSVSVSGTVAGSNAGDTVTISWGDGTISAGNAITGSSWGPVVHTYSSSAMSTNPNNVIATLVSSGSVVRATSTASPVNVQKHATSVTLTPLHPTPWGTSTSFTATLVDTSSGNTAIPSVPIHYTGTGVIGVADANTGATGVAIGNGTAPSTVASGWAAQAHFAGNTLYNSADSSAITYGTIAHRTSLTLNLNPTSLLHGAKYSVSGNLRDVTANLALGSMTVTFTATTPITIPSAVTGSTGNYAVTGLTSPSTPGSYSITSNFAATSLYGASSSQTRTLTVS